ncbi:DUF952 domain-containing protein [Nocardioides sp.]|uniref:DUF952 domain-containing protein n=1 Tax=Nocardioides sp. TaxID=35761 RepID=UPI0039E5BD8B
MRILHIALASEWEAAQRSGFYVTSTLGRSLADEGFIHASREDQWEGVRQRFYAGVTEPLVLLTIDTDLLTSPWREDPVGEETFPHIYGPLNPDAVVAAVPLAPAAQPTAQFPAPPTEAEFRRALIGEIAFRMAMALLLMALIAVGLLIVRAWLGQDWALLGALLGFVLGVVVVVRLGRARSRRLG